MSQLAEIELQTELATLRHIASGLTFARVPDVFKDIESVKVRINVLRDPNHYQKLQAESAAKRRAFTRMKVAA